MLRFSIFLLVIVFIQCTNSSAGKYYVSSSTGNDRNDGKSIKSAWKTIYKVNGKQFLPGDTILFKSGDTWRETLKVPSSGKKDNNIYFSSYGKGAKPQILGSIQAGSWSNHGEKIWKSSATTVNPIETYFKSDIFFIGTDGVINFGSYKRDTSELVSDYQWTWLSGSIYIYSSSDPVTKFKSIEVPQRQQCIDLNNMEFLHFDGLDLFYPRWSGFSYDWSKEMVYLKGLLIENCEIAYVGSKDLMTGYGTEIAYSDMTLRNDTIHDCGRRSVSLDIYGSGFTVNDVTIEKCVFYNGYHTTGVDLSVGNGNNNGSYDGVIIRNNLFYENPTSPLTPTSNFIFIQNYDHAGGGATLNNIYIYCNIFKYPNYSGIMLEGVNGCHIFNNTFFNNNTRILSGSRGHIFANESCTDISIKNNIFYTTLAFDANGAGAEIFTYNTNKSEIDADYNLYYRLNNRLRIVISDGKGFYMNQLSNIRSELNWELHSLPPCDPMFISDSDLHLSEHSPAIGKGVKVEVGRGTNSRALEKDYDGKSFSNPPSIGAFEWNPPSIK